MIIGWTEKQRVWALLEERDLDGYVDGSMARPTESRTKQSTWDKKDRAAMWCIKLTKGDANMGHILGAATSKQMWDQMLKLLYISLIFAVLDVMDLAVFSCCTCRSFPAYVSAPKSGCVQC